MTFVDLFLDMLFVELKKWLIITIIYLFAGFA